MTFKCPKLHKSIFLTFLNSYFFNFLPFCEAKSKSSLQLHRRLNMLPNNDKWNPYDGWYTFSQKLLHQFCSSFTDLGRLIANFNAINEKSTIFMQFISNFQELTATWMGQSLKVWAKLDKYCGFFTISLKIEICN